MREALFAVVASLALDARSAPVPGWCYTNSYTLSEASPGTAALPNRVYMTYGSGITRKIVKAVLTYTGSNITKRAMYYSEDNGNTYVPAGDPSGNYVQTLAYDGSSNLTSTTWGTP